MWCINTFGEDFTSPFSMQQDNKNIFLLLWMDRSYFYNIPSAEESFIVFCICPLVPACFCFFLSVPSLPPTEWGPFFTQRSSITSLHYSTTIFRVDVLLCARCARNLLYVSYFLLLCHCIYNAKLKSSGPSLLIEWGPLWCGVMEKGKHG